MRTDEDLEEDFLDWFFLSKFGKGPNFWRSLPEDKLNSYIIMQGIYEQEYWDNWIQIFKKTR